MLVNDLYSDAMFTAVNTMLPMKVNINIGQLSGVCRACSNRFDSSRMSVLSS